ncbi:trans isomerase FKBP2 [Seminavis robusta]|uniref:peptidylprolyl isomerase n=1 Tax=Seminavis robusta TaxID=568900 RepID=A0A9N8E3I3_9STRA|nr:trans isomerase FKBP2 [Seminavis robusta]|eukprot:Sro616_g175950.1 trans isomerase FKBP2 (166) ;mRNA; f:25229-25726
MTLIKTKPLSPFKACKPLLLVIGLVAIINAMMSGVGHVSAEEVRVEVLRRGDGPAVTKNHKYRSMVTLYIEGESGEKTPSGWSTRKEDGAARDSPFVFQPGVNLIEGWTQGVLQMKEGDRSLLHVPSKLGYGSRPMGSKGGSFYIPANSNLLFDIEIMGKESQTS